MTSRSNWANDNSTLSVWQFERVSLSFP
jgi:hypothetical protein